MKFVALLIISSAICFGVDGLMLKVKDGDTILLKTTDGRKLDVRLDGIDAPEKKQPSGRTSLENLRTICEERSHATVEERGLDQYDRTLGVLYCNGVEANRKQVQDGMAWAYRQYSTEYVEEEESAKAQRIGLWSEQNPVRPDIFRKQEQETKENTQHTLMQQQILRQLMPIGGKR